MGGYIDHTNAFMAFTCVVPLINAAISIASLDDADENSTNYEFNRVRRYHRVRPPKH
jgi:hypothetical protein